MSMYSGSNPSALRSQKWIAEALLALMEEKTFAEISIKEITQRSDLSRQTFYKVFDSKENVLEYYLDTLFHAFLKQIELQKIHSVYELAKLYFFFYEQNKSFVKKLFQNQLSPLLVKRFQKYLTILQGTVYDKKRTVLNAYMESFLSFGLVGILERYSTEEQVQPEELAQMLEKLLQIEL